MVYKNNEKNINETFERLMSADGTIKFLNVLNVV